MTLCMARIAVEPLRYLIDFQRFSDFAGFWVVKRAGEERYLAHAKSVAESTGYGLMRLVATVHQPVEAVAKLPDILAVLIAQEL